MIVIESQRKLIITPPHTASGNLHRALCDSNDYGARWVNGPNPDGECDHHVAALSTAWQSYDVAVVVRHPLDRIFGLYRHHQVATKEHGWDPVPFWMWAAMHLMDHPDLSWFYKWSICRLVDGEVLKRATLLKFETLAEEVGRFIGQTVTLPEQSWSDDRAELLSDVTTCLQLQWHHREDRQTFGYLPVV